MKKLHVIFTMTLLAAVFFIQGCSFSTANMSGLKTSKDKDGKTASTSFKAGETIYAQADIANNPGKVKVKFTLTDPAGKSLEGANVSVDINGDGAATYTLPIPDSMESGSYKLTADMMNEAGEKKDSKNVTMTIDGE